MGFVRMLASLFLANEHGMLSTVLIAGNHTSQYVCTIMSFEQILFICILEVVRVFARKRHRTNGGEWHRNHWKYK